MKTVRTINLGYERFIVPETMKEHDLVMFLGTLAMLQRVNQVHDKSYDKTFSFAIGAAAVCLSTYELYDSEKDANEARDLYNTMKESTVLA